MILATQVLVSLAIAYLALALIGKAVSFIVYCVIIRTMTKIKRNNE